MDGHVYPRGKTFTYVFDLPPDPLTGERNQKTKGGFKTESQAWKACYEAMAKVNKDTLIQDSNMTIKEFLELYLEIHAKPNFKPTSFDTEKTIIDARIIPEIGKIKLKKITPLVIKTFYAKLRNKYSADYVRNIHGVLKRALGQAIILELLEVNIMANVKTPKVPKKEMKFWTFEEWNKFIIAAAGHVHFIVFSMGVYTGMRRGEILGLRWRDVDLENGYLIINQTLNWTRNGIIFQESPKTKASNRKVLLDEFLVADFKARKQQIEEFKRKYGKNYEDHDLVCCYEYGGPVKPKRVWEAFNVLTRRAGLQRIRFHDLRHTYASFLLSIDINPKVAAERMGMSPAMFNERYAHLLPTLQDDSISYIEEKIREGRKKILEPVNN